MTSAAGPIRSDDRTESVADALRHILGNNVALASVTEVVAWNVTGPLFPASRSLLLAQHHDLLSAGERIALRIRAIGHHAVGDDSDGVVTPLSIATDPWPDNAGLIGRLVDGHGAMIEALRAASDVADEREDKATGLLLQSRLLEHEGHREALRRL